MSIFDAFASTDARVNQKVDRVFRGVLALIVTILLLSLSVTRADAAEQRPSPVARKAEVRGTLASLPPIVQPGTSPAAPSDAGTLVATFTPASPGQKVTLERQTRRGWKAVSTATEDAWGSASFAPSVGTYRARTTTDGRTWVTGSVTTTRWQAAFEDEFSGTTLDTSVWNDQKREHESVYAPRTCARVDPSARRVADGVLHLGVALDPALAGAPCDYTSTRAAGTTTGTSPYLLNSQISTEYTRFFRHGIVAARIKPQRAKGMHSGFWMLPAGTTYVDGTPSAGTEIDVMEFFGENGRGNETISSSVHYYEADWEKVSLGDMYPTARRALGRGRSWWNEFHVFSVEWTPTTYVFRVDGREYYRETRAVSQADQYLVLSNLTSDYELGELTSDEMGDTAQVDWVRVFDGTSRQASRVTLGRRAR
ncbi:Glycosyl hydrolases family 16 [Nocardioides alpinus]|uniref:Glycoside hydrolase family 16 protein n=1 Tax=Nocardioides alpinus TaxID=748909 RepID=A0A1I0VYW8_9ACTN|nr:glycoside hydrolase family 16 protein [Nocardioides alpinus]PKH37578.1 glycoside hydrolase family 16 protein [Nocardioides alpinus]SFA81629.1 Glycosyl hydrolases family 16 [Nocardioides alpinus]